MNIREVFYKLGALSARQAIALGEMARPALHANPLDATMAIEMLSGLGGGIAGGTNAPHGQRLNTALLTGSSAASGGGLGHLTGRMLETAIDKKLHLPSGTLSVPLTLAGAYGGGRAGHAFSKRFWGAVPRFRHEHNL